MVCIMISDISWYDLLSVTESMERSNVWFMVYGMVYAKYVQTIAYYIYGKFQKLKCLKVPFLKMKYEMDFLVQWSGLLLEHNAVINQVSIVSCIFFIIFNWYLRITIKYLTVSDNWDMEKYDKNNLNNPTNWNI